jgi:HlyD family secretion protein
MAEKNKNLESLMTVTSFKSWTTLWVLGGLLAGVIGWSIVGSLPERIEGQGMLQTMAGMQQVTAAGEGIVNELHFKEGDQVTVGQLVATVRSVSVTEASRAAERRYQEAQALHQTVQQSEQATIGALQAEAVRKRGLLTDARARLAQHVENRKKNVVTQDVVDRARAEVDAKTAAQRDQDIRNRTRYDSIEKSRARVEAARIELDRNLGTSKQVLQVQSSVAGRVTMIHKRPGDRVFPGQPIADVESVAGGEQIEVVAYIAASNGKRVLPGQRVRLSVAGVAPEEFGYLQGEVVSVSEYPVSAAVAQRVLKDESLTDASYEVRIRPLVADGGRYVWSGAGNDQKVLSGTSVTAAVQVAERKPYTLVLPLNKDDRVPVAERTADTPRGSSN